jgi:hypothetical protein
MSNNNFNYQEHYENFYGKDKYKIISIIKPILVLFGANIIRTFKKFCDELNIIEKDYDIVLDYLMSMILSSFMDTFVDSPEDRIKLISSINKHLKKELNLNKE